ncbi:MAG TPA: MFS transporter [Alcaligenes sp.]|nr:MFS transporter [Alcaligenes sp.]
MATSSTRATVPSPDTLAATDQARRKAFAGSVVGHLVEWYDYGIYGYLAVFIGASFFPSENPIVSILSSFAVFALSFFIRPLGGMFFGPLADRIGRRNTLLIVLTVMAASTFAIGLLPSYASIGIAAPILMVVVRCIQGFSAGGEVGTVATFISEYARPERRGFATSWLLAISAAGLLIGAFVANGLSWLLGNESMQAWGWRIPFLIAGPLGLLTLWLRLRLEDSPAFNQLRANKQIAHSPLREAFRQPRALLLVAGTVTMATALFYLVMTYFTTLLRSSLGLPESSIFTASVLVAVATGALMPLGGLISDRIGRRIPMIIYALAGIPLSLGLFLVAESRDITLFFVLMAAVCLVTGLYGGGVYALMSELLPTRIRATGLAISYNVPVALFGGSAPFIATALITQTGSTAAPGIYFAITCLISLIALALIRDSDFDTGEQA